MWEQGSYNGLHNVEDAFLGAVIPQITYYSHVFLCKIQHLR